MSKYIDKSEAVGEGYLQDWYIHSIAEYGDEKLNEPRWTEKHIEELTQDFIVIPKDTPAADVAPVVHGEWIDGSEMPKPKCGKSKYKDDKQYCSNCCREMFHWKAVIYPSKYCPSCGAKMDGGVTNGEDH